MTEKNMDAKTVASFGDEWSRHTQAEVDPAELQVMFDDYFHIVPWSDLPKDARAFDMGVGTGRWAKFVAARVKELHVVDAAEAALAVARKNLASCSNVTFHCATTDSVPLAPESFDFGYSLGVLHHIPDTQSALNDCARLVKPGGRMLIYLYYRFDNRPGWYRAIWQASELFRGWISRRSPGTKSFLTDTIALTVYWPLSRLAWLVEKAGLNPESIPLAKYRNYGFATLRTDSRDRFGTPLEQRFTRAEIETMMHKAGLHNVVFSERSPYWSAIGIKAGAPK